ncbi:hypothetical protein [Actinomadura fibrosa]|uniref:Leucyl aminopeptidase (Aminopeptidase T) n=1 Tax=Actinomadura fibrosa TaxID=111802 RepID=A0ABW2XD56_9ACTN|nr:hypothetical protein [Actinomadura fibrosa]
MRDRRDVLRMGAQASAAGLLPGLAGQEAAAAETPPGPFTGSYANPYASAPFSYVSEPTASPGSITELMPGVQNLLDHVRLSRGERVLLLAEHTADPVVLQAIAAAAACRDTDVRVLSVPSFSAGGWDRGASLDVEKAAVAQSDVVISATWWGEVHTAPLFFDQIRHLDVRFASLHMAATAGALLTGARFPNEVYYEIKDRALARLTEARRIRVTSASGTDLTFSRPAFTPDTGPMTPGRWEPFPYGGVNFSPAGTDGVLIIEDSTYTGTPETPVRVTFAGGLVRAIEGGIAAERIRRRAPGGYYLRHALIGLNPKVRVAGGTQFEREKHAGAFYCGIDALTDGRPDRSRPGFAHCDCQIDRPTIELDGTPFVANGRLLLLGAPAVRRVAARYGPPELILDDDPLIVLPRRYSGGPVH